MSPEMIALLQDLADVIEKHKAWLGYYCDVEDAIGHRFKNDCSINSIRDAIRAGVEPEKMDGVWNM